MFESSKKFFWWDTNLEDLSDKPCDNLYEKNIKIQKRLLLDGSLFINFICCLTNCSLNRSCYCSKVVLQLRCFFIAQQNMTEDLFVWFQKLKNFLMTQKLLFTHLTAVRYYTQQGGLLHLDIVVLCYFFSVYINTQWLHFLPGVKRDALR